ASREGDSIVHLHCFVQQTRLRALDLQENAAENVARAERAVAEAWATVAAGHSTASPKPFVVSAAIAGIDHAHRLLTLVGPTRIRLADGIDLEPLHEGMRVTIGGTARNGELLGLQVTVRRENA